MINIILSCLASSIIILSYGLIFNQVFFKEDTKRINYYEIGIFGFIFVGFLSLIINFFIPLNKVVGSIFLWVSVIYFIAHLIKSQKKIELFYIIFFLSFVSFSILVISNINRPDAGLYHLPYVSILNENKVIIGLTNIHYRFGHTSIMQHISAIYNNYTFKTEFISSPLASIFSFYLLFVLSEFKKNLDKKNVTLILISFLIIIFSLYSFNRYSNYGNDVPAHIYFFILVMFFLNIPDLKHVSSHFFYKITLISIFLFTLKPFMVIVLLIPLFLFILNKKKLKIIKNTKLVLCLILISIWFLKNILISGCLIFPIKNTCIKSLNYYNENVVNLASNEGEAWAKGFPDQKENSKLTLKEYNANFNWLETWKKNHFKKIQEKILPLLIFILIFTTPYILIKSHNNYQNSNNKIDYNLILITIFSFVCSAYWFFYFPVYRFGMSFLATFIITIYVLIIFQFRSFSKINKTFFWILIIIFFLGSMGKNYNRIFKSYDKYYDGHPWPRIYTLKNNEKNIQKIFESIYDKNNKFLYNYSNGEECMYSKSPCSHMLQKKIYKTKILGFDAFYLNNN